MFCQVNFQIRRLNPDGSICDPPGDEVSETEVFVDMDFSSIIPDTSLCETDLNGDSKTDTDDLLIVIGDFGCATLTCIGDLDASDSVDTADVLFLLSAFGTDCE